MATTPDSGLGKLLEAAEQALERHDASTALDWLRRAEAVAPAIADIRFKKGVALRMAGELQAALAAFDEALACDPYHFLALLMKASLIERLAGAKRAAPLYKNALAIAPADERLPPFLQAQLAHAREVIRADAAALQAHLRAQIAPLRERLPGEPLDRFDESLDIFAGVRRAHVQQPLLLHYPRLPAIPFYDRTLFPWIGELEAATPVIQEELAVALREESDEFTPYIAYRPGEPVNQWGELNHSRRWSSYFLWRDGVRQDAACARCPRTASLLTSLPMAEQPGFAPTAMFSALEPHTHIPPHTGSSNVRLLVHLPLLLPGPARFRVGNVTRNWRMGEAWVFDDTIEHEAWNDADALRIILIFDIWNPYLSEAERALVTAMMAAKQDYYAQ